MGKVTLQNGKGLSVVNLVATDRGATTVACFVGHLPEGGGSDHYKNLSVVRQPNIQFSFPHWESK